VQNPGPPPLVLLACSDEWMSRSFESVFEQQGYAVARVRSRARAIALARRSDPDVVVLEEGAGDLDALSVCAALRDDPLFDHSVPIVITSAAHVTNASRHAAYAAGAWEYCSHPVDLEALMLKLATFRRARSETAVQRAERIVDRETGLYTAQGLERLGEQLGAGAQRKHESFACVALALRTSDREVPGPTVTIEGGDENFAAVAELCLAESRKSDVVGRVGSKRIGILAPSTDEAGARLFVERLRIAVEGAATSAGLSGEYRLRAGICAVPDLGASKLPTTELVKRAATALDHLEFSDADSALLSFDELPPLSS
jgi:PleD family two-component response regulator